MMVKASYLGTGENELRFETEIKEEDIENFLNLVLADEPQRTVEVTFDYYSQSYYYMIKRGTYGENYRGVVAIITKEYDREIADTVRKFHNKPTYGWEG